MAWSDFKYDRGGLHFPDLRLWCDAPAAVRSGDWVCVSHAHADHIARHNRVIVTEPTRHFLRLRLSGEREEHTARYHEPIELAPLAGKRVPDSQLTLLPAGHILGSAMPLIASGGTSLLYTGDFKLRPSPGAETCTPRPADVLVIETTFGLPRYVFPDAAQVVADLIGFCRDTLAAGETPILLGYSLGKAQELLLALAGAGLPIQLHAQVHRLTRAYEQHGIVFPPYAALDPESAQGHVVIAPPGGDVAALRRKLAPARVAVATGWALDPSCRHRYQADAAFPLSDHADFRELVACVRQVGPKKVFTLHGYAAPFAAHLRGLGYEAWSLTGDDQLELLAPDATGALNAPGFRAAPVRPSEE